MAGIIRHPRIGVLPDQSDDNRVDACAGLRLIYPFTHPKVRERFDVTIIGPNARPADYDLIAAQRTLHPMVSINDAESFIASLKRSGIRLVVDLDDNLLDCHPDPGTERSLAQQRVKTRLLLRAADCVIVSTCRLGQRVARLNQNIAVSENALPESWLTRPPAARNGNQVVIGCYGTFTHQRDFMAVAAGIQAALRRLAREARIELCGLSTDPRIVKLFEDTCQIRVLRPIPDYFSFFHFMRNEANWDIGLAPLNRGPFQDSKSDIKFLELAAFGCAGIYSDAPAYASVQDRHTGIICADSPSQWAAAISELVQDATLRGEIRERARAKVEGERTMAKAAARICTILAKALDTSEAAGSGEPIRVDNDVALSARSIPDPR